MVEISREVVARNLHLLSPDDDYWVGQRITRGVQKAEGDQLGPLRPDGDRRVHAAAAEATARISTATASRW